MRLEGARSPCGKRMQMKATGMVKGIRFLILLPANTSKTKWIEFPA